jgi:hypothetical protein
MSHTPYLTREAFSFNKKKAEGIDIPFKHPQTNSLIFEFPSSFSSNSKSQLSSSTCNYYEIGQKSLYIFDDFFSKLEKDQMRSFIEGTTFSRKLYGKQKAEEEGEEPAYTMDNKTKWNFFSSPPPAITTIYKLLSHLSYKLDSEITTQPWELYNNEICVPAVVTNHINHFSKKSEVLDKHDDANPKQGIGYRLPILYSNDNSFFPYNFSNGATDTPWLVSLLIYSTSKSFKPDNGLGTHFYYDDNTLATTASCQDLRFVLFDCDLIHGMQASQQESLMKTSRTSFVFKLAINPRKKGFCAKEKFYQLIQSHQGML